MVLSCVISEVVARTSLPSLPLVQGSPITNPIPFHGLNLSILIHLSAFLLWWLSMFTYQLLLKSLGRSEHPSFYKRMGNLAARTSGYPMTVALVSLLLTNRRAMDHSRRKVRGWWEEQVVLRRQGTNNQPKQGTSQPDARQPEESQLETAQEENSQPKATHGELILQSNRCVISQNSSITTVDI